MSARMWHGDAQSTGASMVYLDFSFTTNGNQNPTLTYSYPPNAASAALARGEGVASVVRTAQGTYLVTLTDGYRYVTAKAPDLEDLTSGSDDGAYCSLGGVTGEGTGNEAVNAISFYVFTRQASGAKQDYGTGGNGGTVTTGNRRVSIQLALKNLGTGK